MRGHIILSKEPANSEGVGWVPEKLEGTDGACRHTCGYHGSRAKLKLIKKNIVSKLIQSNLLMWSPLLRDHLP